MGLMTTLCGPGFQEEAVPLRPTPYSSGSPSSRVSASVWGPSTPEGAPCGGGSRGKSPGLLPICGRAGHLALRLCWPAGLSPSVQTLSLSIMPAQTAAWRKQIFQQLTERTKRELEHFRHYEQAVEQVGSARRHWRSASTTERLQYTVPKGRWKRQTRPFLY